MRTSALIALTLALEAAEPPGSLGSSPRPKAQSLEPSNLRRVADNLRADHFEKAVAEEQMLAHRDRIAKQAIERRLRCEHCDRSSQIVHRLRDVTCRAERML